MKINKILLLVTLFTFIISLKSPYPRIRSGKTLNHYFFPTNLDILYRKELKINKEVTKSASYDNLCNFTVRNVNPDSSLRDVVIGCAIGKVRNLIVFLKTLRTTGCRANCVFLLDDHAYKNVSKKTIKIVTHYGGQVINCGEVLYNKPYDGHNYCYVFIQNFLEINKGEFDRVLICDLFDSVFQGDPFTKRFVTDALNIVDEGQMFDSIDGRTNIQWLEAFNFTVSPYSKKKYLCSGAMAGPPDIVSKAINVYLMQHKFGEGRHDQAAFNFLYFSGAFKKNKIKVVSRRKNEPIRHMSEIQFSKPELGYGTAINNEHAYALIIHHYYVDSQFRDSILRACPKESEDLENYIEMKSGKPPRLLRYGIDPDKNIYQLFSHFIHNLFI